MISFLVRDFRYELRSIPAISPLLRDTTIPHTTTTADGEENSFQPQSFHNNQEGFEDEVDSRQKEISKNILTGQKTPLM